MAAGAESESDERVLQFASLHSLVAAGQIQVLLDIGEAETARRLERLAAGRLLRRHRVDPQGPGLYSITSAGLSRIGSDLPAPFPVVRHRHVLGVGWLWLGARLGRLGALRRVLTGRELEAVDRRARNEALISPSATRRGAGAPIQPFFGFDLEVPRPGEERELHYPDLVLVADDGWIPLDLVLVPWSVERRSAVMAAYAVDPRVARVMFAVAEPGIALSLQLTASSLGLLGMTEFYWVRPHAQRPGLAT